MNQYNYLNFAVWMDSNGKEHLVKARKGYFASDAFIEGDEAFSQILGEKFGGIFGDDGDVATCNRRNIRRLTSDEEFEALYKNTCECFKFLVEFEPKFKEAIRKLPFGKRLRLSCDYQLSIVAAIHQDYPETTVDELVGLIVASESDQ